MAKTVLNKSRVVLVLNEDEPKELALKLIKAQSKIPLDKIPVTTKAQIFDTLINAGIIKF